MYLQLYVDNERLTPLLSPRLSLRVMTLTPQINGVETKEGVSVSVNGVAQVLGQIKETEK